MQVDFHPILTSSSATPCGIELCHTGGCCANETMRADNFFISPNFSNSSYINHFIQPDSIIPDYTNPQSWNRYSYVGNNPVNFNDPSGHMADDESDGAGKRGCNLECFKKGDEGDGKGVGEKKQKETIVETFQIFASSDPYYYRESVEESWSNYTYGGKSSTPIDSFGLFNDLLIGLRPYLLKKYVSYTQSVTLDYVTDYQNIPHVDATKSVTIVNLQIANNSTHGNVNYTIDISGSTMQTILKGSSVSGGQTTFHIPSNLSVDKNTGGIDITIVAFTGCTGSCNYKVKSIVYKGNTNFNFNP